MSLWIIYLKSSYFLLAEVVGKAVGPVGHGDEHDDDGKDELATYLACELSH